MRARIRVADGTSQRTRRVRTPQWGLLRRAAAARPLSDDEGLVDRHQGMRLEQQTHLGIGRSGGKPEVEDAYFVRSQPIVLSVLQSVSGGTFRVVASDIAF